MYAYFAVVQSLFATAVREKYIRVMQFADVAFPLHLYQTFTYTVPPELESMLAPGWRVLAPFGRKRISGIVVRLRDRSDISNPRPIQTILEPFPVIPEDLMKIAFWISEYYMTPIGQVLGTMMPPGMDRETVATVSLIQDIGEFEIRQIRKRRPLLARILQALYVYRKLTVRQLIKKVGSRNLQRALKELHDKRIIALDQTLRDPAVKTLTASYVELSSHLAEDPDMTRSLIDQMPRRSAKQRSILECLLARYDADDPGVLQSELLSTTSSTLAAVKALEKKGYLEISRREKIRFPLEKTGTEVVHFDLTAEQQRAVTAAKDALDHGGFHSFLLHGVTGSGKTQVYLEAIDHAMSRQRTAIVLVPEISLTPQTVRRFRSRFGDRVAVWHSRMSMGERYDAWRHIHTGKFTIVIGARSAVFAPVRNLGLIVVDEEHETTFKQAEPPPQYHARDVAIMRARESGAVVLLGTATPSLESYYNAQTAKSQLLTLTHRIQDVPMPRIEIVDMRAEFDKHTENWEPIFSRALGRSMKDVLDKGKQAILFLNRRGFSHHVHCYACGYVAECPRCSITLTLHVHQSQLRCHYCGHAAYLMECCPECGNGRIVHQGIGTQKVEAQTRERFPDARVLRMDMDTTSQKDSHDKILEIFRARKADVLVGTQMVAKGLDFEHVELVGVISADPGMLLADFRSSEKTFQILTQVAGRAGRKHGQGRVIIQTFHPHRPAIQYAQRHDYGGFYEEEISARKELLYPPVGRMFMIRVTSRDATRAQEVAETVRWRLDPPPEGVHILGPSVAPIEKIRDEYRWQILAKASRSVTLSVLRAWLVSACAAFRTSKDVRVYLEADPYHLL